MTEVSFKVSRDEAALIGRIVDRAAEIWKAHGVEFDALSVDMDITATHANGCPLDLSKLFGFPDVDFTHDVGGIMKHLDRTTGKLGGYFLPRCAKN